MGQYLKKCSSTKLIAKLEVMHELLLPLSYSNDQDASRLLLICALGVFLIRSLAITSCNILEIARGVYRHTCGCTAHCIQKVSRGEGGGQNAALLND